MMVIYGTGVNDAYSTALSSMMHHRFPQDSRNGPVYRIAGPVVTEIIEPRQRVLFSPLRDANPFFHFMEAMWMLAGRRDVEFVAQFNSHIATFSDNGKDFHGAYGHRWRNWFHRDQLKEIIKTFLQDPTSRRCVLQMWDCNHDLGRDGKDFPCNTHIYFDPARYGLNMTVCNRSNDIIWGLYGANFVHMSFLHEFVARSVGMELGIMYTLSNNFHYYPANLKNTLAELYQDSKDDTEWYEEVDWEGFPQLFDQPEESEQFFEDVQRFCDNPANIYPHQTTFLNRVAVPMYSAWQCYKGGLYKEAMKYCCQIQSPDWERACMEWVQRRMK